MSVLIKDMEMPKECYGCRWFYFQGTSCTEPKYYLDARCELVESGQDWYGKDSRGGWVGESIEHIPGWTGYYSYKHCVEMGTMASQCPLCELPSAQPERDTPKRVLWTGWKGHRYTRYNCPNCKKPVRNDDVYCHRCGQRLMFPKVSHTPYVEGQKQEVIVRWDDE